MQSRIVSETGPGNHAAHTPDGPATAHYLTVRRLIRLLSEHPPDLRVVVDGYEAGYDDLSAGQLQRVRIALGVGKEEWVGDHEDPELVIPKERRPSESVEALVLRRRSG